jgi:hypothetical protein
VSSVSNGLYSLTLTLVSVTRVIYTSKGMSKRLGCALSIEKYGNYIIMQSAKPIIFSITLLTYKSMVVVHLARSVEHKHKGCR